MDGLPWGRAVSATLVLIGVTGAMNARQGMHPRLHRRCGGRDEHQASEHPLLHDMVCEKGRKAGRQEG